MPSKFRFHPRELFWMVLPVVILAGLAFWKARGNSSMMFGALPPDINKGGPRLEVTDIVPAPANLSPNDVAKGYVWSANATLWQKGGSPINLKKSQRDSTYGHTQADVFYRRGKAWRLAPPLSKNGRLDWMDRVEGIDNAQSEQVLGDFPTKKQLSFKVNLNGVPRDAKEISVRGRFLYENFYQGGACTTLRPSQNWLLFGNRCQFTLSIPLDIPIKRTNEPWPRPDISRTPTIDFVGAHWITSSNRSTFLVHLRSTTGSFPAHLSLNRFDIYDGNGKEQKIYYGYSSGQTPEAVNLLIFGLPEVKNTSLPANERLFDLSLKGGPLDGWAYLKGPLHLVAQISDGTNWPTNIDVKLNLQQKSPTDFGASTNDYY